MISTSHRERMMLAGLFLAKFDREGLSCLGFSSFAEAFNTIGHSLGGKPASIKNYRQEFDPLFPNHRRGWHKRPLRGHCRALFERFGHLSLPEFSRMLSQVLLAPALPLLEGIEDLAALEGGASDGNAFENESVARRMITGAAAEGYFAFAFPGLPEFAGHSLTDVTLYGCGFDFRVTPPGGGPFFAVEVKGIAEAAGEIMMTDKEYRVSRHLGDRYFLCVVRNFADDPTLSLIRDPLKSELRFDRRERRPTVVAWHAKVSC